MSTWQVQAAKARFSEFLQKSLTEGPQIVTRRGAPAAVLLPIDEWHRLQGASRQTLKQILLAPEPRVHVPVPPRGHARRRTLPRFA